MDKEQKWMKRRVGMITASELSNIVSASGKVIDGNVSYIRSKRFERAHGYSLPVSSRIMDIGNETEPEIVEWLRANGEPDIIYSKDLPEIPFWVSPECPLGASPDAFYEDESVVFECKTLVGNEATEFFMDVYTPMEDKRARVWKEHGDQILGQFLSNPKVKTVVLCKYAPQRDDILDDTDSPLARWRGITFTFSRDCYMESIENMRNLIILFDKMIDAKINPVKFKSGKWAVEDGKLVER